MARMARAGSPRAARARSLGDMTSAIAGVVVRDATLEDAEAIAHVEVMTWQATYAGLLPTELLAGMSVARAHARWLRGIGMSSRPSSTYVVLVAEVAGSVVAIASGSAHRGSSRMARLDMLYVLPHFQGLGAGGALLAAFATRMSDAAVTALWVEVLAKNMPARGFYKRRGALELSRTWTFFGTKPVVVVAYGWSLPDGIARITR